VQDKLEEYEAEADCEVTKLNIAAMESSLAEARVVTVESELKKREEELTALNQTVLQLTTRLANWKESINKKVEEDKTYYADLFKE
jgi:chromosome segregation ATPase